MSNKTEYDYEVKNGTHWAGLPKMNGKTADLKNFSTGQELRVTMPSSRELHDLLCVIFNRG